MNLQSCGMWCDEPTSWCTLVSLVIPLTRLLTSNIRNQIAIWLRVPIAATDVGLGAREQITSARTFCTVVFAGSLDADAADIFVRTHYC